MPLAAIHNIVTLETCAQDVLYMRCKRTFISLIPPLNDMYVLFIP